MAQAVTSRAVVPFFMAFEQVDISGDVGIRACGSSCAEAFAQAAVGMYSLITEVEAVADRSLLEVVVSASTIEGLLIKFLNELIFQFDAHGFVGRAHRGHRFL